LSDSFFYLNDDMFIGRPLPLSLYEPLWCPVIDLSAVDPQRPEPTNLAQEHCENAVNLFSRGRPGPRPRVRVAHFGAVMVKEACREAWRRFGRELHQQEARPLRGRDTINFQLLAALVAGDVGVAVTRTRQAAKRVLSCAMIESEPEGLSHVLSERPHHFCVNGITAENIPGFRQFCLDFISRCNERPPPISIWSWAAETHHAREKTAWLQRGDDRVTVA